MTNTKPVIKYTNRDFTSIKEDLIRYAQVYYPDSYKDFNKASFGSLLFDLVSLIGDQLSFYIDYNTNEVLFDSAIEFKNVQRLARTLGYKTSGGSSSQGEEIFYIKVPANSNSEPDLNYLPILERGSNFKSTAGASFTLAEDVNFQHPLAEVQVANVDQTTGEPTFYAIKHRGTVISGQEYVQQTIVTSAEKFLKIKIQNSNVTEIISVVDSLGNQYYQVDYLTQNIVFDAVRNSGDNSTSVQNKLVPKHVPRRFIVENNDKGTYLVFGNGSVDKLIDPYSILLNYESREYVTDRSFDPSNIMESDKLGVSPTNTTLTIKYRANDNINVNVPIGGLSKTIISKFRFPVDNLNPTLESGVRTSLLIDNEEQILGNISELTTDEIKLRALDHFATQNRAVTKEDYIALCYRMNSKFGSIKRVNLVQDKKSFKRNLNLYVMSEDANGNLAIANQELKNNLKIWINHYKMINDNVDILDAKIVNFGIDFEVIGMPNYSKFQIFTDCITALKELFNRKFDIGEPISISNIYKKLNLVESVSDTTKVIISIKNSTGYNFSSFDKQEYLSADSRVIYCDDDTIFELLYPNTDLNGSVI